MGNIGYHSASNRIRKRPCFFHVEAGHPKCLYLVIVYLAGARSASAMHPMSGHNLGFSTPSPQPSPSG
jgi:hypothetical protein